MKPLSLPLQTLYLLSLTLCGAAQAQTRNSYVVNTLSDTNGGVCDASDCTLREAIDAANGDGADSEITFAAGSPITLNGNALFLGADGALRITGAAAGVMISGNNANTVFSVNSGADATLADLTISGGSGYNGGGIYNLGTLTVNRSTIAGSRGYNGGGIHNAGTSYEYFVRGYHIGFNGDSSDVAAATAASVVSPIRNPSSIQTPSGGLS